MLELWEDHEYSEISEILKKEFGFSKSPNAIKKAYQRYTKNPDLLNTIQKIQ